MCSTFRNEKNVLLKNISLKMKTKLTIKQKFFVINLETSLIYLMFFFLMKKLFKKRYFILLLNESVIFLLNFIRIKKKFPFFIILTHFN